METPALLKAISFACRAHAGQVAKDGETPYAAHVLRVAWTVRHEFGCEDETILTAACLHDVLEDARADYDELAREFGAEVADMAAALSKDNRLPEAERERVYYAGLAQCSWRTRLVKVADSCDILRQSAGTPKLEKAVERARHTLELANGDEPAMVKGRKTLSQLLQEAQICLAASPEQNGSG